MGFNPNPTIKPPFGSSIDKEHPLSTGLRVCSILNEGIGYKLFDISGYNNNTNFNQGVRWGNEGIITSGTQYGLIAASNSLNFTTSFSVRCKMLFLSKAAGEYPYVMDKGIGGQTTSSWSIQWNDSVNLLRFQINVGGTLYNLDSTFSPDVNTIYDIVGTYDGSVAKFYINGEKQSEVVVSGSIYISTHPIAIAVAYPIPSATDTYANANYKCYQLWGNVLNENNVLQLYYEPYCFISWPINRKHFYVTTTVIVNLILSSIQESQQFKSLGLIQDQNISLNNILNNEQLSSVLLQQIYNLFTSNIDENQILQNIFLSQIQNVNVSTLQENQSLSSISVTTGIVLALTAIAQNQNISLIKLLQIQNIITELLEQDQNVSLATITQIQNVLSQAISQNQDISSVAVNTAIVLALSALLQSQQLEQITITQDQNILLDALNQQEQLTQLLLTQIQNIKTSNIDENQSISSVALNLALVLVLSAINQNQNLSSALISQIQTIFVDAINQINDVKDLTVSQLLDIVIQNILQDNVLSDVFLKQYEAIPEPIKTLVAEFFDFIIKFKP